MRGWRWRWGVSFYVFACGNGDEGVAHELYRGLGYEPVVNREIQDEKYRWMGSEVMKKDLVGNDGDGMINDDNYLITISLILSVYVYIYYNI